MLFLSFPLYFCNNHFPNRTYKNLLPGINGYFFPRLPK
ncbi:hypothetical protein BACUNI_00021 [Bacteroides uniformis ATCC 8492]|uniref:Uncharacterized protein n=1 Tax=Bacteroides uniformis (strain ATCC 8492 / DSM 6597 / CCUG 4942 / CIP 103695 / JCM 5828 / KCTC 5204 / NCTC 13054 / VPI 0061) TaxID=411479 RepID=A0ABC9NHW0_BACUC|nr:hypothetical protein BACUNI_00021 [Bacteroides uniformis ATCC 8492]